MATSTDTITLPSGIQISEAPAVGWRVFVPEDLLYDVSAPDIEAFIAIAIGRPKQRVMFINLESGGAEAFIS